MTEDQQTITVDEDVKPDVQAILTSGILEKRLENLYQLRHRTAQDLLQTLFLWDEGRVKGDVLRHKTRAFKQILERIAIVESGVSQPEVTVITKGEQAPETPTTAQDSSDNSQPVN